MAVATEDVEEKTTQQKENGKVDYTLKIVWFNVYLFLFFHATALYGLYFCFTSTYAKTNLFAFIYGYLGGLGITTGAHRLWCHRSYKAKLPLRIFLMILCSIAGQNDLYVWCRDHRVHHKFTETSADPHNIKRGFFFAHIGWLMCRKHPDVIVKGKTVELDDLWDDPVVRFHKRFYIPMFLVFSVYVPTMIPVWCWNETLWNSFFTCVFVRYCISLHFSWLVNSAAHKFGDHPYDKHIEATENSIVSILALGEGWHNYHHVFPWDYSTSELGYTFNISKAFIDFMAMIGQAYDLKVANPNMVKSTKVKSGDGNRIGDIKNR